jgi:hypothetical protein
MYSRFTINQEKNIDLLGNAHRQMLHSKIASNPKFKKLEIECYSCKKEKPYNNQLEREIFLTNNNSIQKALKKSRNKGNFFLKTIYKNSKNTIIYPESSTRIYMNKYLFDTNKNVKDFINERRLIKKLKYINKLKVELKEKRENEIECDLNLLEYDRILLLKSQMLLKQFETDRNHYNRYLLNELMMHNQILLKLKFKKSMLEGKVTNLKKKIEDLRNKSNVLKEYKNFLLCVKKHASSFDKYLTKAVIDVSKEKKNDDNIVGTNNNKNNMGKNGLAKRNFMKKRYSVYMPLLKKNTYTVKKNVVNIKENNIKKKVTYDEKNIEDKLENNSFNHKDNKSETEIFESSYEFNSKMNKIEDTLFTLIYKNNKIRRELVELNLKKKMK